MTKKIEVMRQMKIFSGFEPYQMELLEPLMEMCVYQDGEEIFQQGDPAEHLYIVIEGRVAIVYKPEDGTEITVAKIKKDGVFGWSAAFGTGAYTSGAVCREAGQFLRIRGEDLKMLRLNHPKTGILVLDRLAKVVASRLRQTHHHEQVVAMLEDGLINGVKPIGG